MDEEIDQSRKSLRPIFPDLSEKQLKEVEDVFYGYIETAWQIFERMERENLNPAGEAHRENKGESKFDSPQESAKS